MRYLWQFYHKTSIFAQLQATSNLLDRVSVPSPIAIDILMDTMARDRAHMYWFSVYISEVLEIISFTLKSPSDV